MSLTPFHRLPAIAAALVLLPALPGCAVVSVASTAVGAAVSIGGAAVSVGSAVVGTTAKATGKVVEKSIDVAFPPNPPPTR
jgi:hypothetical protein